MKKFSAKKIVLPNIPYILIAFAGTKIDMGFRLAPGSDLSQKLLNISVGFGKAFSNFMPSFDPKDIFIVIGLAVIIKIAVYVKGRDAKKFRKNEEYGSARCGA